MKYLVCYDTNMRDLTDTKLTLSRQAGRISMLGWRESKDAGKLLERATQLIEQAQDLIGPEAEASARERYEEHAGRK